MAKRIGKYKVSNRERVMNQEDGNTVKDVLSNTGTYRHSSLKEVGRYYLDEEFS